MPDYSSEKAPWYSRRQIIEKVVIENGVTSIGDYAFRGCNSLTSITIPNSVTSIGDYAFSECYRLTSITIPNSVTSIGDYAFYGCSGLTSITIPNSVTSIGGDAFYGTKWYDNQPDGVVYAGKVLYAYKGTMPSNTKIDIKEGTTEITPSAFYNCKALTSVTIPNSVTSIGSCAFYGCYGLTSVHITDLVSWCKINFMAYYDSDCYSNPLYYAKHLYISGKEIENLVIPNGITKIENYAFCNCKSFKSITIPNSVTSIGNSAFFGCSEPTSITVDKGNKYFDSRNNCNAIIETKSNTLISGCKNTIIPNSVTSIGGGAFYGCSGLTSITIPNSVTSIGNSAFYFCSGLTSITIPESVTSIGGSAFDGAKLRSIVIKAKTPPSGFDDDSKYSTFSKQSYYHTTLMIPEGCWDAYAYDNYWYKFINIREMTYYAVNLTNSKAYMLKSSNEGSYLFYDSVNDCVAALNETALDDTEENVTWMTTEVDGKHYVYNLGAKKFLVADKANAKTGYRLSDVPASIDIEDGKDAIVFGKSKEFYMVINDKLNVDEDLESQIIATTGIKGISVDANQPTVTYSVNGQVVPNDTKGLHIKNGKKVIVK